MVGDLLTLEAKDGMAGFALRAVGVDDSLGRVEGRLSSLSLLARRLFSVPSALLLLLVVLQPL